MTFPNANETETAITTAIPAVEFSLKQTLPIPPVAHLCHAIQEALPNTGGHIVSFAGLQAGEAYGRIAFETAYVAATQLGLRVLFVDAMTTERKSLAALSSAVHSPLAKVIASGGRVEDSMVSIANTRMSYMLMGKLGAGGLTLADLDMTSGVFKKLRAYYDLIIIEAPSVLDGPFGVAIVKITDGAVLVVEAEKTRAPVALHGKHLIEVAGGRVIGAVLNNRRQFIPGWIYRRL
jgi:Mrp family chromosome partitioning ATPase